MKDKIFWEISYFHEDELEGIEIFAQRAKAYLAGKKFLEANKGEKVKYLIRPVKENEIDFDQ